MSKDDTSLLARVFGISRLREDQTAVVAALRCNGDCLVVMRTGGGKSVCFQLPCLTAEGCTVVVCPLQAISRDQVLKLRGNGVAAAVYDGECDRATKRAVLQKLSAPEECCIKALYTTPETLLRSTALCRTLTSLYGKGRLQRIVFDEAHCVVSWGSTFR